MQPIIHWIFKRKKLLILLKITDYIYNTISLSRHEQGASNSLIKDTSSWRLNLLFMNTEQRSENIFTGYTSVYAHNKQNFNCFLTSQKCKL